MNGVADPGSLLLSPCVGTCVLDQRAGWCVGCGRTGDEIASWGGYEAAGRAAVWCHLPERLQVVGTAYSLAPWTPALLLDRLAVIARTDRITWRTHQASMWSDADASVSRTDDQLRVESTSGVLSLGLLPGLRAFRLPAAKLLVLALHSSRVPAAQRRDRFAVTRAVRVVGEANTAEYQVLESLPTDYRGILAIETEVQHHV